MTRTGASQKGSWRGVRSCVQALVLAFVPVCALQAQSLEDLEKRVRAQEKRQSEEKAEATVAAEKRRAAANAAAESAEKHRATEAAKAAEARRVATAAAYNQCWDGCMLPQPHACKKEEQASERASELDGKSLDYLAQWSDALVSNSPSADRFRRASDLAKEYANEYRGKARSYRLECKVEEDKCERRCDR